MRRLIAQLARFGVVGAVGFVVDTVLFNVLLATVLRPEDVAAGPVIAKVISTAVAIFVNWVGNRHWTFRDQRRSATAKEGVEFVVVSLGGLAISIGCLAVSHYVLGFTSAFADTVSGNVIGLVLGTAFRFWLYRVWVYRPDRDAGHDSGREADQDDPPEADQDDPREADRGPERTLVG
ncbi:MULTISPECIES: GtrA family protein [unclassified Curtobacterium]|uniref:GtrA family protein n=1 Tax=unclassified Curtobacterium TaxID=257496 RepID=UPI00226B8528|nr:MULTISPECIES: GtrA family protein [unclassified Curtobacterium]